MASHAVAGIEAKATVLSGRLEAGLQALKVDVSAAQQQQLLGFLALLVKWNSVYNLTSVRDEGDMLSVHLLDALSIVDLVDRIGGQTVLDVGSGAGIPAIPLAIVRPLLAVHSIDAVDKKIAFQLQARSTLGLKNLHPLHARVETSTPTQPHNVIVSRAFADIATMLGAVDRLASENTKVIAMKGKKPVEELAALPVGWEVDRIEALDVPFLGAERCAVVLRRAPNSIGNRA